MALLGDRRGLTVADMEAIHGDILSLPAVAARPLWERITPRTAREARALSLLRGWDGRMEADRPEPLLYSAWREALVRRLLGGAAALPQDPSPLTVAAAPALAARWRGRVVALALAGDPRVVPPGPAGEDLLSEVFAEGMAELSRRLPGEPEGWRWGDLHRLAPGGSGGSPSEGPFGLALPGDPDTVRAAGYLPETGFAVESGSVARYAFDLGDWDASGWVIPHGVGGEPDHPHFADQVSAWRQARLLPMAYSPAAVATITVAQEELHPASPRAGPSRRT
jgi:penicillin amidase